MHRVLKVLEPMAAVEVGDFWALGIALEAAVLPEDELRLAVSSGRAAQALSSSSMGTAETYWASVDRSATLDELRASAIVVPPDRKAQLTEYEDRLDDRDVLGVLWGPFWTEQARGAVRHLTGAQQARVLKEYAHLLAALEERWCTAAKLRERATFIDQLRSDAPIDAAQLQAWLVRSRRRSVRHLVRGLRARFLTHDVEAAIGAVTESAARIAAPLEWRNALRFELLRLAVRVVRGRPWAPITLAAIDDEPPAFARQPAYAGRSIEGAPHDVDVPSPRPSEVPEAWTALDEVEQRAVSSTLRRVAARLAEADRENPGGVHGTPGIDIVACDGEAARRTVHVMVDNMIWHMAMSGSDWFDHNIYAGSFVFAHGTLVGETIERRAKISVSEHDEPAYDRAVATRARVAREQARE